MCAAMMRTVAFTALLLLAGCSSPRDKAQADVDFLEKHGGTAHEKCDAYTKVVAADVETHDTRNWELDRVMQRSTCTIARLNGQLSAEE